MSVFRQEAKAKRIAKTIKLSEKISDLFQLANEGSSESSVELATTKIMYNGYNVVLTLNCKYVSLTQEDDEKFEEMRENDFQIDVAGDTPHIK